MDVIIIISLIFVGWCYANYKMIRAENHAVRFLGIMLGIGTACLVGFIGLFVLSTVLLSGI